jgi:hypothetical protein
VLNKTTIAYYAYEAESVAWRLKCTLFYSGMDAQDIVMTEAGLRPLIPPTTHNYQLIKILVILIWYL